jgi:acetyl-CoA carboxylase biotin carboxylase subunit
MAKPRMFHRIFIANRGEVAARIARACDQLGIEPVFGVSEADRDAPYTRDRETVLLGPGRSSESYLRTDRVVQAARQARCTALHPGWGFLAENPMFAALCEAHGVTFIGPSARVMALMGSKSPAKRAVASSGLTLIDGSDGPLAGVEEAREVAERVGYPVLLKAESGGGGRGMRVARSGGEIEGAFSEAQAEAQAAFGDGRVYLEKLIEGGRHVEIQILADRYGNAVHIGERDCTVQRNHQKLIEESPAPSLDPAERQRVLAAAVRAAVEIGYVGAGTIEFLLDDSGTLRFMEMNTRLQVEHCVSEMRSGIDLVVEQIQVAAGAPLSITQDDVTLDGHAIECRINAEDPADNFRPGPGVIREWQSPGSEDGAVRVDTHVAAGYEVPPFYDSLICKVIAHGADRDAACDRMIAALEELRCEGVPTTVPMHLAILRSPAFRSGDYDTRAIPGWPPAEG